MKIRTIRKKNLFKKDEIYLNKDDVINYLKATAELIQDKRIEETLDEMAELFDKAV